MNANEDVLNTRVVARYGTGGKMTTGKVIAACDAPQLFIEADDGARFWWRADLCSPEKENDNAP